ncbi:class I SAM-dependent methyltransferase [Lysinibacillus sp. NPDC093216]|uniref:class I SAM-dependent methyltransferase n=1 Tax=Lysinibacillus sp. NPDC093216 TaxID=3390576 RepID=UPI003CFEDD35
MSILAWEQIWEEIFRNNEWGKYPAEDLVRFIARNFYKVEDRKSIRILEVGSGPGANVWYIAREGFSVYGIDGSPTAVKRANERLDKEVQGWNGEIIQGDFTVIPYENDFFDAVIDNESICINSFEESNKIFSEIYRVLKSNGKIFTKTFANGSWGEGTGEKVGYNSWIVSEGPLKGTGYCRFSTKEDVLDLLNNFQIEEFEYITRSYQNGEHEIKEWVVVASKK